MPQGKGNQMHNRREYGKYGKPVPDNIDVSKSSENIILVDKDIREAYKDIFGEALEKYNSKQKRADRKIEDYYNHIQKSRNGEKLFYEDIVQWGSKDDFTSPETREKAKKALVKYIEGFEERNQNLKLVGAYIHMDEASPHLHLDYIPVATGYSRGLEKRNSLDKAMKQMGFQPERESRKNNATKLWKERERNYFGTLCRNMGLEVEVERQSDRKNLTVEEYKDAREKMIGKIERDRESIINKAKDEASDIIKAAQETSNYKTESANDYYFKTTREADALKKQAEHQISTVTEQERQLTQRKLEQDQRELELKERIRVLEEKLDDKDRTISSLQTKLKLLNLRIFKEKCAHWMYRANIVSCAMDNLKQKLEQEQQSEKQNNKRNRGYDR